MVTSDQAPNYDHLTGAQARVMRAEQARLAETYARRAIQARASGRRGAARQWTAAYCQSAEQCRLLGQRIRDELRQFAAPQP